MDPGVREVGMAERNVAEQIDRSNFDKTIKFLEDYKELLEKMFSCAEEDIRKLGYTGFHVNRRCADSQIAYLPIRYLINMDFEVYLALDGIVDGDPTEVLVIAKITVGSDNVHIDDYALRNHQGDWQYLGPDGWVSSEDARKYCWIERDEAE